MTDRISTHRKLFLNEWFTVNSTGLFVLICLVYMALQFAKRVFIIDSIAAFEILHERGEMWFFDIFFGWQYFSIPIFLAWKWTWTTLLLWVGCFAYGYRLHFNHLWKSVMIAEIVFLLPEVLKLLWFMVLETDPNYHEYVAFYPLSLMHVVDHTEIDPKWHYPLKAVHLFEGIYWVVLALEIYFLSGKNLKTSAKIVASSYVLFFFLWLLFYVSGY